MIEILAAATLIAALLTEQSQEKEIGLHQRFPVNRPQGAEQLLSWFWKNYALSGAPALVLAWRLHHGLSQAKAAKLAGILSSDWGNAERIPKPSLEKMQPHQGVIPERIAMQLEALTNIPVHAWLPNRERLEEARAFRSPPSYSWHRQAAWGYVETPSEHARLRTVMNIGSERGIDRRTVNIWEVVDPHAGLQTAVGHGSWYKTVPKEKPLPKLPPVSELIQRPGKRSPVLIQEWQPDPDLAELEESLERHRDPAWAMDWA